MTNDNIYNRGHATGDVSNFNSTTIPLAAGATWTGEWEKVDDYASLTIMVSCDTNGTLYLESSSDATNVDRSLQMSSGSDTMTGIQAAIIISKYIRVKVVNGSSPQTYLRVQTILNTGSKIAIPTSRLSTGYNAYSSAINVRTVNDPFLDLSTGLYSGRSSFSVNGRHSAVTTSPVVVCSTETTYTGFLTSASTVRIKSGGNANDTAAGSGARSVIVYGLDQDFNLAQETITTAGTSASSSTTTTFIRVFRATVEQCGTYSDGITGANIGNIAIETTGGTLLTQIKAGQGESQCGVYTIPAGKTGYIVKIAATVESTKPADIQLFQRENADDTSAPLGCKKTLHTIFGLSGVSHDWLDVYYKVNAKTDLWFVANAVSGGSNTGVATELDLILLDN